MSVADRLSDQPLILVVDDFESVRTLITLALLRAGYHVLSASSQAEAIALVDRLRLQVSAAVIDLHFPITSEDQVTTELRRRQPDLPLVFLSAGGHDQDALLPGLLLEKPFSFRALCTILANLLALSAEGIRIHST
jgi:two-component system, cell cycle sensor histidine kinase and response regulator CckA